MPQPKITKDRTSGQNESSARVIRELVDHSPHHLAASKARAAFSTRPEMSSSGRSMGGSSRIELTSAAACSTTGRLPARSVDGALGRLRLAVA